MPRESGRSAVVVCRTRALSRAASPCQNRIVHRPRVVFRCVASLLASAAVACGSASPTAPPTAPPLLPEEPPLVAPPAPIAASVDGGVADADVAAAAADDDAQAVDDRARLDALPYRQPFAPPALGAAPATRYARLDARACKKELGARGVAFREVRAGPRGVNMPVRLAEPLRGVRVVAPGGKGNHDVLDCRLALALDDAAGVLAAQQVSAVRIDSFHRQGARLAGRKRKPSQHALGLAADVMSFTLADGRTVTIAADWDGGRGEPACGPEAGPSAPRAETIAVRNIVCALAAAGIFHRVLTPGYDAAHESHLHLDIARDAKAMSVR